MANVAIHPATHSVCGLAGGIHVDYRAEVIGIQPHPISRAFECISILLKGDMPKPPGSLRRPPLLAQVVAPRGLQYYWDYRRALWAQIESLN
jgi:hypothetical protein